MTELDCSVASCLYNQDKLCCLSGIKVEGTTADVSDSTACASFVERKKENYTNAYDGEGPKEELSIECMAERCVYNKGFNCCAEHINVAGNGARHALATRCATFKLD